ncbi:uncharacterized protein LOC129745067 [Uranotaenia lowii]|uniref:uncharacterized protein LOC129745067 n=1 Tax=Uranotaenia lowii TaxID=190385 RepID=UPI00247A499D|nr:uncharacterized protein LOC129745067 [Uranotaenia lowii]
MHEETFAQLMEMFGDYIDHQRIQKISSAHGHDLELCIEKLLKHDDEPSPLVGDKQQQVTAEQQWPVLPTREEPKNSTGAIKKTMSQAKDSAMSPVSFASFLQNKENQGFVNKLQTPTKMGPKRSANAQEWPSNFETIVDFINRGFRVMVLMRGAPGSGKSFLARAVIDKTLANGDYRNHVFSADDYFMVNGVYKYQADRIDEAHRFNQNNVRAKAKDGWSPLVVDNTHMRHWEMHAYVQIAAENGYYLDVLEPVTYWRNNARSLGARNVHGVPEHKIKAMLGNYERLRDINDLYRQCKLEHASKELPRMRHFPIIRQDLIDLGSLQNSINEIPEKEEPTLPEWSTADWDTANENSVESKENLEINNPGQLVSKPARGKPKHMIASSRHLLPAAEEDLLDVDNLQENWNWPVITDDKWKPYDEECLNFWAQSDAVTNQQLEKSKIELNQSQPKRFTVPKIDTSLEEQSLPQNFVPSEGLTPMETTPIKMIEKKSDRTQANNKRIALVKHKRGCKNEDSSFSEICNLYPHIPAHYLWDLFEKCNGDGDWTANLLLEEQKTYEFDGMTNGFDEAIGGGQMAFECDCSEPIATQVPLNSEQSSDTDRSTVSSGSPRSTIRKKDKALSEDLQRAKKQLEAMVVLGKNNYSDHLQQIRVAGGKITKESLMEFEEPEDTAKDEPTKSEILEVNLGLDLIKQLHAIFKDKHSAKHLSIDDITPEQTKVYISTEIAEQLFLSFMDTIYSYREEEKHFTMRRDAQIAKQMEIKQKYPILFRDIRADSDTPNLNDIIEMERAMSAYRNEQTNGWVKQVPQDLATQMTRQKLVQMFPSVEEKVLTEILHAHNNKFHDTVNVLNNSIPEEFRNQIAKEREALLLRAENEKQKALPTQSTVLPTTPRISNEDAINLHLKTAEECRNLSQHHQDLKNECHEKARNAIQRGMAGVADYYAQIARLHRTKIDWYNSKASNSIMEVHKLTLNNSDVLDLHYLHSEEALRCLEIFLAEHAGKLRTRQQQYKELFIITGRGLHSADGIPIIKHRVQATLKDLGLRFSELNPGFLKIKLYNNPDMLERLLTQC